jgi:hypothetical protein
VKAACAGKIFSVAALDLKFQPASKRDERHKRDAELALLGFGHRFINSIGSRFCKRPNRSILDAGIIFVAKGRNPLLPSFS